MNPNRKWCRKFSVICGLFFLFASIRVHSRLIFRLFWLRSPYLRKSASHPRFVFSVRCRVRLVIGRRIPVIVCNGRYGLKCYFLRFSNGFLRGERSGNQHLSSRNP